MKQQHIVFLFPTTGLYNPDNHLVMAISNILHTGENKIYNVIRNKYGLSYIVHVGVNNNIEAGYLYISINVNCEKTDKAISILKDILKHAQTRSRGRDFITKAELDLYKSAVRAEQQSLQRGTGIGHFLERIKKYRDIHNLDEFYNKYYTISLGELNGFAAELLDLNRARIYTYGGAR